PARGRAGRDGMDRGRVALLVALAACQGAAAAPSPLGASIAVPASWIELPRVAATAKGAMSASADARAAAWGDPASGCYLVIVSARGAKDDAAESQHALDAALGAKIDEAGLHGKSQGWAVADGDDVV